MLITRGPQKGRVVRWSSANDLRIGSGDDADVTLADPKADALHAQVVRKAGQWFIRDLDSRAGTFVNLMRVKGFVRISDGDQVIIGDSMLACCTETSVEVEEPTDPGSTHEPADNCAAERLADTPVSSEPETSDTGWLSAVNDAEAWPVDDDAASRRVEDIEPRTTGIVSDVSDDTPAEDEDVFGGWADALDSAMVHSPRDTDADAKDRAG